MSFQILSLSGGGFLGLYTISVLAELERVSGQPIARSFDLIAGTSIGGIVALGLAAEVPASEIKDAFEEDGESIFSKNRAPQKFAETVNDLRKFLFRSKYPGRHLKSTIERILGEDSRMGDLEHRVIVPTVNLSKGAPQLFKTPHHPSLKRDYRIKLSDVGLATSAAPAFFPIAEIGDTLFADGGLYANSPDALAVHEAEHFLGASRAEISLLSVGTTTSKFSFAHSTGKKLGLFQWARGQRLLKVAMASQQASVDFMMRHQLGERYLRIDAVQSPEQERDLALDVATDDAKKTIRSLAEASIQEVISNPFLDTLLKHNPNPPIFFEGS
jgi:uncharacterized protein